ncbi:MAG: MFS transporter, partial [Pseudomonadota bacterium]|nr:MFS transporter [Pseudomonadota bacterium]
ISNVGMWVMRIGIGWFTWELTYSGAWLGAIALIQAGPSLVLVPFAGAIADRFDRLTILRVTQLGSVILSAGIAAMALADMVNIYVLATYAFLHGIVGTFGIPARVTIGPNLVPKEDVSAAIAVSSVIFGSATFIGPALAGVIINWIGIGYTFALNGLTFLLMYIALGMITLARAEHQTSGSSLTSDVVEGIRYVAGHAGILPVIVLTISAAILARPLTELLPGFADVIFERGSDGLAAMMSSFGIGGMVGSLWLANRNRVEGTTTILLMGSATLGVLTAVFASTASFAAALVIMLVLGLAGSATMNGAQILIQSAVEGSMRARVMSLYSFNYRAAPALGAMIMGSASSEMGLQFPVAIGALTLLAIWYWVFVRRRRLRQALESISTISAKVGPSSSGSAAE